MVRPRASHDFRREGDLPAGLRVVEDPPAPLQPFRDGRVLLRLEGFRMSGSSSEKLSVGHGARITCPLAESGTVWIVAKTVTVAASSVSSDQHAHPAPSCRLSFLLLLPLASV